MEKTRITKLVNESVTISSPKESIEIPDSGLILEKDRAKEFSKSIETLNTLGKIQVEDMETSKVMVVREGQTVQQVLDSITDASETNKYLVLVPSGHELEYFDWKPNVEVKFLDNLDERWQLDELEGWNDLDNWITVGLDKEIEEYEGGKRIKCTVTNEWNYLKMTDLDLRKYQGIMVDMWHENKVGATHPINIRIQTGFTDTDFIGTSTYADQGVGNYFRTIFIPLNIDKNHFNYISDLSLIDWDSVTFLRFIVSGIDVGDTYYLSNFRLVRTFPYPCIFMRTDDSVIGGYLRVQALRELERRNIPAIWAIIANDLLDVTSINNNYPSQDLLYDFQQKGLTSIVNHSYSHPNFKDLNEKDTLFQVEASRFIFERLGLKDALRWWVNPYGSTNPLLEKTLKEFGYKSVYSHMNEIPLDSALIYDEIPEYFRPIKKGGIHTLLFHASDVANEEKLNEFLIKVENLKQFCRFVSIRDIERLMNNSHEKFSPRQTKPTLFQVLDSDFDMYFYHKQLFLDPNGTDRNINVQPYELRPGDPALVVNTGSTGNLIFDSSGLNLTIQPGQSAYVVYDGDQWRQI